MPTYTDAEAINFFKFFGMYGAEIGIMFCLIVIAFALCNIRDEIKKIRKALDDKEN